MLACVLTFKHETESEILVFIILVVSILEIVG